MRAKVLLANWKAVHIPFDSEIPNTPVDNEFLACAENSPLKEEKQNDETVTFLFVDNAQKDAKLDKFYGVHFIGRLKQDLMSLDGQTFPAGTLVMSVYAGLPSSEELAAGKIPREQTLLMATEEVIVEP